MIRGILAKKIGMTQIFDDQGRDGYEAVQLGLVEPDRPLKLEPRDENGWRRRAKGRRRVPWPLMRHFEKAGVPPTRFLAEVPVDGDDPVNPGDAVLVEIFKPADRVRVIGRSRGRGFQGVIRRHHARGGRATHGSMFHREPGSIGSSAYPSRVLPGLKMPGHMGDRRVTMKNVRVVKVDADRNLLFLKGGVPGARNGFLRIVMVS